MTQAADCVFKNSVDWLDNVWINIYAENVAMGLDSLDPQKELEENVILKRIWNGILVELSTEFRLSCWREWIPNSWLGQLNNIYIEYYLSGDQAFSIESCIDDNDNGNIMTICNNFISVFGCSEYRI